MTELERQELNKLIDEELKQLKVQRKELEKEVVEKRMAEFKELKQYHFERQDFVDAFEEIFTTDEIMGIEELCRSNTTLEDFHLFYTTWEEYYIIHFPSGIMINWYKHLGRTNTCNKDDFELVDLKAFLKLLKNNLPYDEAD